MKIRLPIRFLFPAAVGLVLLITGLCGSADAVESPTATPTKATEPPPSPEELAERRQEALDNIQDALDEDEEEAAKFLGSTPVKDLSLESLEELGDKAAQFVRQKQFERMQEQREQQDRLQNYQNWQSARR